MKTPFFITGLPRSRTAWLANAFTHGDCFCFHEALRLVGKPDDLPRLFCDTEAELIGDSDPSLTQHYQAIVNLWPDAKIVFVFRDSNAAARSYGKFALQHPVLSQLLDGHGNVWGRLRADLNQAAHVHPAENRMMVNYEELDARLPDIWRFVMDGRPYPKQRMEMLRAMRVDTIPQVAEAGVHETLKEKIITALPQSSVPTHKHQAYNRLLAELCGSDKGAYVWLQQMLELMLTWDHVVDGDELDLGMVDRVFENALLDWPLNPFWQTNAFRLGPVLSACIAAWRDDATNPIKGWDGYTELPCAVAFILGGQTRVNQFSEHLRRLADEMRVEDNQTDERKSLWQ